MQDEKAIVAIAGDKITELSALSNVFSENLNIEAINADIMAIDAAAKAIEADELAQITDVASLEGYELKDLKRMRTELNKSYKALDDARKSLKRNYDKPMAEVKNRCDEISKNANHALDILKVAIDRITAEREAFKWQQLEEEYENIAPQFVRENVALDRIVNPKWRNQSLNVVKLQEELDDAVADILRSYETIMNAEITYKSEALDAFFDTLNINEAFAAESRAKEREARIKETQRLSEEAKAEAESYRVGSVSPEPVEVPQPRYSYTLKFAANDEEFAALIEALKALGINGTYTREEMEG